MSTIISMTNIDGTISPTEDARIPVLDRGFLYGDSVYEVFRTYTGVPLFYDEHFDRLENSAQLISMHIKQSREELTEEIRRTVKASVSGKGADVYVRYQITRGEGKIDLYPSPDLQTRYVIIVKELPPWNEDFYSIGMSMAVPSVRRNPVNSLDPNIKGGNYLNNILALTQAREYGADDCVILSREGNVTEASNSNVWFVIDNELVTPGSGNLKGLTKRALHEALKDNGVASQERNVRGDEIASATECFVSSATREIMPVKSIRLENGNVVEFPSGGGDITRKAQSAFKEFIASYLEAHEHLRLF
ncbi:MAG: aminotransferase class IV [Gammaproteobacteria bacterium]|nr:aminotransferase class IV [Gammaproteobacteria bacterium]